MSRNTSQRRGYVKDDARTNRRKNLRLRPMQTEVEDDGPTDERTSMECEESRKAGREQISTIPPSATCIIVRPCAHLDLHDYERQVLTVQKQKQKEARAGLGFLSSGLKYRKTTVRKNSELDRSKRQKVNERI